MRQESYTAIMVSQSNIEKGRVQQKLRTRKALIEAAWELLKEGKQPTVDEVAEKALVSRATAYRYFPNRERLLIEAVLNRETPDPQKILAGSPSDSPGDRVGLVQEYLYSQVTKSETLHRSLLRACQEEWIQNKNRFVLRGDERLELLEEALRASGAERDKDEYQNLIFALAAMVGLESYVVLRDVCQVDQKRGKEIMNWAVRKLVEATLKK